MAEKGPKLTYKAPEISLEEGTRAYLFPEFFSGLKYEEPIPMPTTPTTAEALERMNAYLKSIQEQGGQVLGFVNLDVAEEKNHYGRVLKRAHSFDYSDRAVFNRTFIVVNKPS